MGVYKLAQLQIRPSAIAGAWYPGSATLLKKTIEDYLVDVPVFDSKRTIHGIISPHAGYIYSGAIAAYGYRQIQDCDYDLVVILSPIHQYYSGKYIINEADLYATPLGEVPVDKEAIEKLKRSVDITFVSYDEEHALEIQLPFLQVVLNSFKILPIMFGPTKLDETDELIADLLPIITSQRTLIVISTDLHHINDYAEVHVRDQNVINALKSFNLTELRKILNRTECSVCGKVPLFTGLKILESIGHTQIQILKHLNSGDVTGEKNRGQYTVGYLSGIVY